MIAHEYDEEARQCVFIEYPNFTSSMVKLLMVGVGIYTSAMLSNFVCFIIMFLFGVVRFKLS